MKQSAVIFNRFFLLIMCLLFLLNACSGTVENAVLPESDTLKIQKLNAEALSCCKANNFNTDFCFIVDMSIHSGKYRFFVWNFKEQKITAQGLVTHGCGRGGWSDDGTKATPQFSNVCESHCSSLGKYKVADRGYSQWGMNIKYLLYGLDSTNSNALKRTIVLHSWEAVSDDEIFPSGSPESWGCPAVSNNFMMELDALLKSSDKPVLLWMIN